MRPKTHDVTVERGVPMTARDGTVLLADVYHPVGAGPTPVLLERTAYGRATMGMAGAGEAFASRGYRYVLQACRGTDGSGGSHSWFGETEDGRDCADWIAAQPWFDGNLGTYGASYMGYTQWALASTRPPHLKAMSVALSTTDRVFSWYTGGSIALEVLIPWDLMALQFNRPSAPDLEAMASLEAVAQRMRQLDAAFHHLPLGGALRSIAGEDLPLYTDQIAHASAEDPHWQPLRHRRMLAAWDIPLLLIEGWQDYPLPGVIADYEALRSSDAPVWLRIGAGGHLGGGGEGAAFDAPLEWFDAHLRGDGRTATAHRRVSLHVQGHEPRWQEFADWAPPADATSWFLQPDGGLAPEVPPPSDPDEHRYDPADPTPSVGGIGMLTGGVVDNGALERRDDVLVYTSAPLTEPLTVIGEVAATIELSSTCPHVDVFVRVCDVHADGSSWNVTDGLRRFVLDATSTCADGVFVAQVPLWPTAYCFGPGHRVRVQVSGGAHPVYARNLGTGEPPATATTMTTSDRRIHHDPAHPSRIVLPHQPPR